MGIVAAVRVCNIEQGLSVRVFATVEERFNHLLLPMKYKKQLGNLLCERTEKNPAALRGLAATAVYAGAEIMVESFRPVFHGVFFADIVAPLLGGTVLLACGAEIADGRLRESEYLKLENEIARLEFKAALRKLEFNYDWRTRL